MTKVMQVQSAARDQRATASRRRGIPKACMVLHDPPGSSRLEGFDAAFTSGLRRIRCSRGLEDILERGLADSAITGSSLQPRYLKRIRGFIPHEM